MEGLNSDEILPLANYFKQRKEEIENRIKHLSQTEIDDKLIGFKDQLDINDDYSVDKKDFDQMVLPQLLDWATNESTAQKSSLILLLLILFNDWKRGTSKLTKISLKESLIPKLMSINDSTYSTDIKELVLNIHLFLCFIVANDKIEVKKDLILNDELMIGTTIGNLENLSNESLIKDWLLVLQFYIFYTQKYEKIFDVLPILTKLLKGSETIVSQTCYTLLVFSQSFREARIELMDTNICQRLTDIWIKHENNKQIVKPIFAIIKVHLSRFNDYKNKFLSKEFNILDTIPSLLKSSVELNRIYGLEIIKLIALRPLSAKIYTTTLQIDTLIKYKVFENINNILEFDDSLQVKSNALDAIFVAAFMTSSFDQIKSIVDQGTLQALCSQMESNDEEIIRKSVLTISMFLFEEFKEILEKEQKFADPNKSLTPFATIIKDSEGLNHLNRLNTQRIEKEYQKNKNVSECKIKKEGYKLSDTETIIEETLILSFGVGVRPQHRKVKKEILTKIVDYRPAIDCLECGNAYMATRDIFNCGHISYCLRCSVDAILDSYSGGEPKCPMKDEKDKEKECNKPLSTANVPYYFLRDKLSKEYFGQESKVEKQIETNKYL